MTFIILLIISIISIIVSFLRIIVLVFYVCYVYGRMNLSCVMIYTDGSIYYYGRTLWTDRRTLLCLCVLLLCGCVLVCLNA